jgi:hypothetical protein
MDNCTCTCICTCTCAAVVLNVKKKTADKGVVVKSCRPYTNKQTQLTTHKSQPLMWRQLVSPSFLNSYLSYHHHHHVQNKRDTSSLLSNECHSPKPKKSETSFNPTLWWIINGSLPPRSSCTIHRHLRTLELRWINHPWMHMLISSTRY